MRTNKRLTVCLAVTAVIGAVLLLILLTGKSEPRYGGKPISGWLAETQPFGRQLTSSDKASLRALKAMGPAAEAYLVKELRKNDSRWDRAYRSVWFKLPRLLQARFPNPFKPSKRERAAWVLARLWPESNETILALVKSLPDPSQSIRACSAEALGKIPQLSREVESALIRASNDPDPIVRANAASSLRFIRGDNQATGRVSQQVSNGPTPPPLVMFTQIPASVKNPVVLVTSSPGWGISSSDFEWKSAPDLIKDLRRPQTEACYQAACFLAEAGPAAQQAVPALVATLENPAEHVRAAAVRALGNIGPAARSAIPAIRGSLNPENSQIYRRLVREAVRKIDPQSEPDVFDK